MDATMTITKNAEGKYAGTWSSQWGESTLSDITVDAGKVKFIQTSNFGGQDFKTSYEGTLEDGKLKGTSKNQYGELAFEGTRGETKDQADPLAGEWQMNIKIPAREIVDKMTITQNQDGTLAGKWEGMRGGENTISNLKFADGKLTFTRTSKMGGNDFSLDLHRDRHRRHDKGRFQQRLRRERNYGRPRRRQNGNTKGRTKQTPSRKEIAALFPNPYLTPGPAWGFSFARSSPLCFLPLQNEQFAYSPSSTAEVKLIARYKGAAAVIAQERKPRGFARP